jgi:hypothetical protein
MPNKQGARELGSKGASETSLRALAAYAEAQR